MTPEEQEAYRDNLRARYVARLEELRNAPAHYAEAANTGTFTYTTLNDAFVNTVMPAGYRYAIEPREVRLEDDPIRFTTGDTMPRVRFARPATTQDDTPMEKTMKEYQSTGRGFTNDESYGAFSLLERIIQGVRVTREGIKIDQGELTASDMESLTPQERAALLRVLDILSTQTGDSPVPKSASATWT